MKHSFRYVIEKNKQIMIINISFGLKSNYAKNNISIENAETLVFSSLVDL